MGDIKQRQDLCLPPDTVWNLARLTQNKLTTWSVREGQSRASITLTFDKSKASQYFPTSTETQSKGRQTTEVSSQLETRKLGKRKKVSDNVQYVTKCASAQSPPGEVIVIDSDDPLIGNGLCPGVHHGDVIVLDADVQQTTDHVIIIDDECTVKCDKEATTTTSVLSLVTKEKTEHKQDETPEHTQLRIASDRISSTGDVITPEAVSEAIKTEQHKLVFTTTSLLSSGTCDKAAVVAQVSDVDVFGEDTDTLDTTISQSVCVHKKKCKTPEISSTGDIIPSEQLSRTHNKTGDVAFLSGGAHFVADDADTLAQNVLEDKKPNATPERPLLRITSDGVTSREDAITSEVVSESIKTEEHKPVFSCTNTTAALSAPEKTLSLKRSVPLNRPATATTDSQLTHSGDAETPGCSESKKLRSEQESGVPAHIKPPAAVPESFLVCLTVGDCLTYIDAELITANFHKVSSRYGEGTHKIFKKKTEFYVRDENKVSRKGKKTKIITINWIRKNRGAMSDGFRQHLFLKGLQKTLKPRNKRHIISRKDIRRYYQLYTYKRPNTFLDCPTVDDCLAFIDAELVDTRFHLSSCYGEGTYTIYDNKEEFYVHDNRRENGGMKRTHIPDITLDWIRNNKEVLACGFRRHLFLKVLQKSLKPLNGSDRISEEQSSQYIELHNYKRPISKIPRSNS